jgi:hypothetical protein
MKKTLKDWRLALRFAEAQGISPAAIIGLTGRAWAELVSLASEWEAVFRDVDPSVLEAMQQRAEKDEQRERELNLFYSCGGGDDDE